MVRRRLAALMGIALVMVGALAAATLDAAAVPPPNPYTSSTLAEVYDGTGFVDDKPSPASSFINADNGFYPGDNGPTDGNVTSSDHVGYFWETRVAAGPQRTVEVTLDLPEYLTFERALNKTLCVTAAGVKGVYNNNAGRPGCTYQVGAGQSFSTGVELTLTAKDTSGVIQENQVLKTVNSIKGQPVYNSDSAEEVTVLSAPSADLLVRPEQCSAGGSCSSLPSTTTSSSFIVFPEPLRWQDYDSLKGATATTAWSAQLDVTQMPEGTAYKIDDNAVFPAAGILDLPATVGSLTIDYTVPEGWGGNGFEEGESRDFPVHLIVPETAFSAADYLNNGDGWEPGQGEGSAHSTLDNRGSGSHRGYYYPNNDWTMAKVYKPLAPPSEEIFDKTITRPWNSNQTLWEEGNTTFTDGGAAATFSSKQTTGHRKVTEGTQIRSELAAYPANGADVVPDATIVLMDTWDLGELKLDGNPYLLDGNGDPLVGHTYSIQWSPTVIDQTGANPNNSSGWFSTSPAAADPSKVKSVRAVIEGVDLGAGGPTQITLVIPQKVASPYPVENPSAFFDTMYGSAGEDTTTLGNNVVPVTTPTPSVGLSGRNNPTTVNRANGTIEYTYSPTVAGLTSSTEPITGETSFALDPCVTGVDITGSGWDLVAFSAGSGCMTEDEHRGSLVVRPSGDAWVPGNNYSASTGVARLPSVVFSATINPLVIGDITVTGLWTLTNPEGAQPSAPYTTTAIAGDFTLTTPSLATSTAKAEIGDPLKFTASVSAKGEGQDSLAAEAILILPGRGDDAAYLATLEAQTGNTSYQESGNPTESHFSGTYLASHLAVDTETSVQGATIECTRDADPSMNPTVGTWNSDCVDDSANPITAVKIIQPEGKSSAGVHVNVELTPTDNEAGDIYLTWLGPIYVDGTADRMVWPVHDKVVASTISGYTYWDASGKGLARQDSSKPVEGMTVQLLGEDSQEVASTTVNENGYYEFAGLHSGKYYTQVPAIGEQGGAPGTLKSHHDPNLDVDVQQTLSYSGKRGDQSSSKSTAINLRVDPTVPNVNFGYSASDPYSDLLKIPAQVMCEGDEVQCDVTWDITVTNPAPISDEPPFPTDLAGGRLTDATSNAVYDIEMTTGEKVVQAIGTRPAGPSYGSGVVTEAGAYYIVKSDGAIIRPELHLDKTFYTPLSETVNGDFTTREYRLPVLAPGEEVTYTVSGKVNRPSHEATEGVGFVIGNQAWESFSETPRSAPALPEPPLPAYEPSDPYAYGQWTGNDTCTATDDWETFGDQCGQVFAQVEPTNQKLGALAGLVWWDQNRNGVQDTGEPTIVGAKVILYQGVNATFTSKVGETLTDSHGRYDFANLVPSAASPSDGYYVVFSPNTNPDVNDDGTVKPLLEPGQSWVYTTEYDMSPYFGEFKSAANQNGVTHNVTVEADGTTQPVNAGLAVYEAGVDVIKGSMVDESLEQTVEPELDMERPGFTKPITVTASSTNTGTEALNHLAIADVTEVGPDVVWESCSISNPVSTEDLSTSSWNDHTFTHALPSESTVNPRGTITCTGTLTIADAETGHQNWAQVYAVGELSKRIAAADTAFNAKSGLHEPPSISLPNSGGQTALLFLTLSGVVGSGAVYQLWRARRESVGRSRTT